MLNKRGSDSNSFFLLKKQSRKRVIFRFIVIFDFENDNTYADVFVKIAG